MRQIKSVCRMTLLVGVLCLVLIPGTKGFAADTNPCSDDIAKFCPNVQPNDRGAIMDCLETHESELSDACKAYEERMGGSRVESREIRRQYKAILQTCKNDVAKFCKDVDPLKGGFVNCLNEHEKGLSETCRESLNRIKGEEKKTQ